jgi:hypothetical protein
LSNTDLVKKAVGGEIQVQPLVGVMNIGAQKLMKFIFIVHTNIHDISTNRKKLNPPQGQQQRRLHEGTLLFISTGRENYRCLRYTTPGTPSHGFVNHAEHLPRHP